MSRKGYPIDQILALFAPSDVVDASSFGTYYSKKSYRPFSHKKQFEHSIQAFKRPRQIITNAPVQGPPEELDWVPQFSPTSPTSPRIEIDFVPTKIPEPTFVPTKTTEPDIIPEPVSFPKLLTPEPISEPYVNRPPSPLIQPNIPPLDATKFQTPNNDMYGVYIPSYDSPPKQAMDWQPVVSEPLNEPEPEPQQEEPVIKRSVSNDLPPEINDQPIDKLPSQTQENAAPRSPTFTPSTKAKTYNGTTPGPRKKERSKFDTYIPPPKPDLDEIIQEETAREPMKRHSSQPIEPPKAAVSTFSPTQKSKPYLGASLPPYNAKQQQQASIYDVYIPEQAAPPPPRPKKESEIDRLIREEQKKSRPPEPVVEDKPAPSPVPSFAPSEKAKKYDGAKPATKNKYAPYVPPPPEPEPAAPPAPEPKRVSKIDLMIQEEQKHAQPRQPQAPVEAPKPAQPSFAPQTQAKRYDGTSVQSKKKAKYVPYEATSEPEPEPARQPEPKKPSIIDQMIQEEQKKSKPAVAAKPQEEARHEMPTFAPAAAAKPYTGADTKRKKQKFTPMAEMGPTQQLPTKQPTPPKPKKESQFERLMAQEEANKLGSQVKPKPGVASAAKGFNELMSEEVTKKAEMAATPQFTPQPVPRPKPAAKASAKDEDLFWGTAEVVDEYVGESWPALNENRGKAKPKPRPLHGKKKLSPVEWMRRKLIDELGDDEPNLDELAEALIEMNKKEMVDAMVTLFGEPGVAQRIADLFFKQGF